MIKTKNYWTFERMTDLKDGQYIFFNDQAGAISRAKHNFFQRIYPSSRRFQDVMI